LTEDILTWSLRVRNGIFPSFQDIGQQASCRMIGVLVFPDFQLLDAAGPISVFEIGARFSALGETRGMGVAWTGGRS